MITENKCACGGEMENGTCKMCGMKMGNKSEMVSKFVCTSCGKKSSEAGKCCGMDMKKEEHVHEAGKVCPVCSVK